MPQICTAIDFARGSDSMKHTLFRKGIANRLITYILNMIVFSKATVETAVANTPAINLYKKHGFVEFKRWTPPDGIQKLAMSVEHAI